MSEIKKVSLVECAVGSENWVHTVQEFILNNLSVCFACGQTITYKRDFLYMQGRMGTVMIHHDCFSTSKAKLPTGELMNLFDAARYLGVRYATLYQRVRNGRIAGEKREGVWYVSRTDLDTWQDRRKGAVSHGESKSLGSKSRMWRSEVTEAPERVTAMEGARMIGVSRGWILSRREKFDAVKISGAWYLSKKLVEDYIRDEERDGIEPSG